MGFKLSLEIPVFFSALAFMLTVSVNSNLLIYRTCYVLLHHNQSNCAKLGFVNDNATETLEKLVEPTATYIQLVRTIVESAFGSVLCLVVAPWSDRFGRKPVIVVAFVGGTISLLLHIVFAAVDTLTPWFMLVISVPIILTGGGVSFLTVVSAYLSDSTTPEERGLRMGILDVVMALASLIGNTSSSYILIATNYFIVYCIATACQLVALGYAIFFVPESLPERETKNPIAGIFSKSNIIQMLKTPFIQREGSKRTLLLLIMISMLLGFTSTGSGQLFFFFVREKLQWTLTKFTWYGTVVNILGLFATAVVVYLFHTVLKIKETVLIFVGSLFSVVSLITLGLALKDWQVYLGAILNLPSYGQGALMRSLISKLVHEEEVAKILSAFNIGSNVLNPLSSIGYTALYNATINTDAGLYNFVTAGIVFGCSIIFMFALIVQRKASIEEYDVLESDENSSEPENVIANEINST
ncbi:hypothetical protein HUJ04_002793 [Dendroctonus ponderosae]